MLNVSSHALADFDTPEPQICMPSPFPLCVCLSQVRTAIDLGKIKSNTCRLNMIWLTVEFGLDNTVAHFTEPSSFAKKEKTHGLAPVAEKMFGN